MIESLVAGLAVLIDPYHIGLLFLGVMLGIVIGIIPGIRGTVGFALILPFVFGLTPTAGIAVLISIFYSSNNRFLLALTNPQKRTKLKSYCSHSN